LSHNIGFSEPARVWEEALPLGNGRLGAMVYGRPGREIIQLNEDSIWSGYYRDRNNPAAKDALPSIRRLLAEGRIREAEELCLEALSGVPPVQRVYQTAGSLAIDFSPEGRFGHAASGARAEDPLGALPAYYRSLDILRAAAKTTFEWRGVRFEREYLSSVPHEVIAIRFTASRPGMISFRAHLDRGIFSDRLWSLGNDTIALGVDTGIPFCVMARAVCSGGAARTRGGFLVVEQADEALLLVDIRTAFRETDCGAACLANLNRVAGFPYETLRTAHEADYRGFYDRLCLDVAGGQDMVRYYNFCRYLLISSSRPGTLPANLQGIWNPHMDPPWGCDYTININTQMNYWPACMCGLAETEEPLFDLLERAYSNGTKTAEVMYGCRGFVLHHNTDIWGDSAPRDYWLPGTYWPLGAAWLAAHLWEHYEYTRDRAFLKKYYYLIHDAAFFFVDFLVPGNGKSGQNDAGEPYLAASPSVSPENTRRLGAGPDAETGSLCAGCEMDSQIVRALFHAAIMGSELLGEEAGDRACFSAILTRLAPPRILPDGTIAEWNPLPNGEECGETEPGHRHMSHLWALYPGDEIWPDSTPELAEAARKTLERRLANGGGHTGWSRAWIINFYARLGDGERALEHLKALLEKSTLPNLFNSHPPFQIDGNFGALAGITQMFAQSRLLWDAGQPLVELRILPALPQSWHTGSVKGIRVKGNIEVDIAWRDMTLTALSLWSHGGEVSVALCYRDWRQDITVKAGMRYCPTLYD
jgi:alpha-L-fucosidase 2